MEFWHVLLTSSLISAMVSVIISHVLSVRRDREARLFQTRREIYAKLLAALSVFRIERIDEIYDLFSEATLLASPELDALLNEHAKLLYDIDKQEDFTEVEDEYWRSLNAIKTQMRQEIGVDPTTS